VSNLADLLDAHRDALITRWMAAVRRELVVPEPVPDVELANSMPDYLKQLVQMLRAKPDGDKDSASSESNVAREHGKQRYRLGFELEEVVREYGVLRGLIFDLIEQSEVAMTLADVRGLSDFIATGISDGVRQFIEERDAAQRLAASAERQHFEQLFTHAPSVMALLSGPDFLFDFANSAFHRLVGLHRPLLGKAMRDAVPELISQGLLEGLSRVYRTGEPQHERELPIWLTTENGRSKESILNFLFQPFRTREGQIQGVLLHAVDVTEEVRARRAEQLARASAERDAVELAAILQAIPDAIYVGDVSSVRYANRRAFELLGYPTVESLNRNVETMWRELNIRDAATGEPVPVDQVTYARALRGETSSAEVLVRNQQTGKDVVIHSSGAPVRLGERILGAVVINTDVTDRKLLEAERETREQFEHQLIGIVSHDLTNPVSAIILGSSMLLKQKTLEPRVKKGLERIHDTANRAARLIADLLDFTKARLGSGVPVNVATIDFRDQVHGMIEDLQQWHPGRTIVLEEHASGVGQWDPDRLNQIVSNLVGNALQYSPRTTPVTVRTQGDDQEVEIQVQNLGPPIPQATIPELFEPMKRVTEHEGPRRSVGLGLYIVDQIVRAHHGVVMVESTEEKGTTFTVRLPRRFEGG
jgi:PAS domain S-box-containing protein